MTYIALGFVHQTTDFRNHDDGCARRAWDLLLQSTVHRLVSQVDLPIVSVRTICPGVAPETVETEVTMRIEEAINPVQGVKHINSTTTEGVSIVVAAFDLRISNSPDTNEPWEPLLRQTK